MSLLWAAEPIRFRLEDSGAAAIISEHASRGLFEGYPGTVIDIDSPAIAEQAPVFQDARTRAEDPALIFYTSGTTGRAKGIVHAHRTLLGHNEFEHCHQLSESGGFIARPLGAAFFGRYGDRIGRNKMLGLCVLIMSAATFCIGILPTFAVIGVWAPILLFVFRAVRGFTTGGEYTGSSAFIVEYAPAGKRAAYANIIPATVGLASVAGA